MTARIVGVNELMARTGIGMAELKLAQKAIVGAAGNILRNEERRRTKRTVGRSIRVTVRGNGMGASAKVKPGRLGHLFEGGVKRHTIRPKKGRVLAGGGQAGKKGMGPATRPTFFAREVRHPGMKARPYIKASLAAAQPQVKAVAQLALEKLAIKIAGR